jgi:glycine/D-amino acid oxidase-like deaminating enzyme
MAWAYGFSLVGVTSAVGIGLLISAMISSSTRAKAPTSHVETSQSFRLVH